jgi:hypothetical protein
VIHSPSRDSYVPPHPPGRPAGRQLVGRRRNRCCGTPAAVN